MLFLSSTLQTVNIKEFFNMPAYLKVMDISDYLSNNILCSVFCVNGALGLHYNPRVVGMNNVNAKEVLLPLRPNREQC